MRLQNQMPKDDKNIVEVRIKSRGGDEELAKLIRTILKFADEIA